jgi:hypothetical protein
MPRTIALLIVLLSMTVTAGAAERPWQTGTWGEVTTKRKLIDFGPGSSPFGRAGAQPTMRAMADVRRFVIETDEMRIEMEDTVPVGRRSIDPLPGEAVTFAIEKKAVYVRDAEGREHKLRLTKRVDRPRAADGR